MNTQGGQKTEIMHKYFHLYTSLGCPNSIKVYTNEVLVCFKSEFVMLTACCKGLFSSQLSVQTLL